MNGLNYFWLLLLLNPLLVIALILGVRSFWFRQSDGLTRMATTLIKLTDSFSEALIELVKWFALAMVLLTALLVVGRYVFGLGSLKGQEAVIYLHAGLFLFAAGGTLLHDGHVRVDVVFGRLSLTQKTIVDLLGSLVFLIPVCLLILVFSHGYVAQAWKFLEGSPEADGLHLVFLLKSAIPAFAVLVLLQASAQVLRAILQLTGHPVIAAKTHVEMI